MLKAASGNTNNIFFIGFRNMNNSVKQAYQSDLQQPIEAFQFKRKKKPV